MKRVPVMAVYRIVYISAQTVAFDDAALAELLAVARKNNAELGISGMLLYHEGSFMQVLEGQQADVEKLYEKIAQDDRHDNTTVVLRGDVDERTFDEWAMGYLPTRSLRDIPEGFHPFLRANYQHGDDTGDAVVSALRAFKDGRWRAKL